MRTIARPLCFLGRGGQMAKRDHPTAVPDGGGVDVAIPKEIQGFVTWE